MQGLIGFLASSNGRIARIAAGIVLIAIGAFALQGAGQIVLIVIGLIPLIAGLFDLCFFAPLAGLPLSGKEIRKG
jgi:hypothetical protein